MGYRPRGGKESDTTWQLNSSSCLVYIYMYSNLLSILKLFLKFTLHCTDFSGGKNGKQSARNAGDPSLIPESGRFPGEGNGNTLQNSCLENSMDRGAWWATVHGVARRWT